MSFRTRLTTFFAVIVVVPMIAIGFLVFRLIDQSSQGKADARASGLASAAASLYFADSAAARSDAVTIARAVSPLRGNALRTRVSALATRAGLARVTVDVGPRTVANIGNDTALAPGTARVTPPGHPAITVAAAEVTATDYARTLQAPGAAVVVRQGPRTLSSTLPGSPAEALPAHGTVAIRGTSYRVISQSFHGFGGRPVQVTVLSDTSATSSSVASSRALAAAFIAGFLLLALGFAVLASRALGGQLGRFLEAARQVGGGDFSSRVPIQGGDEFAALGQQFNEMSEQLANRIDELAEERARLRESIRRIGQTFAANLDRQALLELALQTAVDGVRAQSGRLTTRATQDDPLSEAVRMGSLDGVEEHVLEAEGRALSDGGLGEAGNERARIASVALGEFEPGGRVHGLITVAREAEFDDDDRDLLRSLANQATLALENIELHYQVQRQAITDELTGLANHGRFQELLGLELEEASRYRYPVGLIMLDVDDFKAINDSYGHQQGDVVLRQVARVLRDNSREVDAPARYGGEELALILPHTDLEGAYAIADRIRAAIEALRIPRLDRSGVLRVTASAGVSTSSGGSRQSLIADADAALYEAKRNGKNRTVKASPQPANVISAE